MLSSRQMGLSCGSATRTARSLPDAVVMSVSRAVVSRARPWRLLRAAAVAENAVSTATAAEYNRTMQQAMGWDHLNPYEYHPERGIYWHEVFPNLICGSQPRTRSDIDQLKAGGVTTILNLQQDKDMKHWNVNRNDITHRCRELGIHWVQRSIQDFDPHSLRKVIPSAVQAVYHGLQNGGRVYVHCTAGLGRAPAVCIAYIHWFSDMQLDEAYKHLTSQRPCGPKRDAIRGATYDLMSGREFHHFEHLPSHAFASMNDNDRNNVQYRCLRGF